jgi:hypothetical protein
MGDVLARDSTTLELSLVFNAIEKNLLVETPDMLRGRSKRVDPLNIKQSTDHTIFNLSIHNHTVNEYSNHHRANLIEASSSKRFHTRTRTRHGEQFDTMGRSMTDRTRNDGFGIKRVCGTQSTQSLTTGVTPGF